MPKRMQSTIVNLNQNFDIPHTIPDYHLIMPDCPSSCINSVYNSFVPTSLFKYS